MTSDDLYFRYAVEVNNLDELFNYILHFVNGRFLGNLRELLSVCMEWFRGLEKGLCMDSWIPKLCDTDIYFYYFVTH